MSGYQFHFEVSARMIHDLHLKGNHLLVFALLDHYTKKNGFCVHSCGTIADMLGLNFGTVANAIRSLHKHNRYIEIEKSYTSDNDLVHKIRTIV